MANPNDGKIEYAFKCRNCGSLEGPDAAGELEQPAACRVCGKGLHFDDSTGARVLEPENWIVLADLSESELAELSEIHRFDPDTHRIVAHTPALSSADRAPESIDRSAEESLGGEDQA